MNIFTNNTTLNTSSNKISNIFRAASFISSSVTVKNGDLRVNKACSEELQCTHTFSDQRFSNCDSKKGRSHIHTEERTDIKNFQI